MLFEIICYSLSGFFMKYSDDAMDTRGNTVISVIADILCVIFTLLVSITSGDAACIFLSIVIATVAASKVDSINHIISAILFILILFMAGFPGFSIICLTVCTIAAYIDEKGNDISDERQEKNEKQGFTGTFFKYRYAMKLAVFFFSVIGILNMYLPAGMFMSFYFNPVTFIYFYLFDLCYEIAGLYFDRLYKTF